MKRIQVVGLLLWRGGLLLSSSWGLFRGARYALSRFVLPLQLEIGAACVLAGLGLVMLSLILERMQDARAEEEPTP